MICYFVADQKSSFYQSGDFIKIVQYVQKGKSKGRMKETNGKLTLSFSNVRMWKQQITYFERFLTKQEINRFIKKTILLRRLEFPNTLNQIHLVDIVLEKITIFVL